MTHPNMPEQWLPPVEPKRGFKHMETHHNRIQQNPYTPSSLALMTAYQNSRIQGKVPRNVALKRQNTIVWQNQLHVPIVASIWKPHASTRAQLAFLSSVTHRICEWHSWYHPRSSKAWTIIHGISRGRLRDHPLEPLDLPVPILCFLWR